MQCSAMRGGGRATGPSHWAEPPRLTVRCAASTLARCDPTRRHGATQPQRVQRSAPHKSGLKSRKHCKFVLRCPYCFWPLSLHILLLLTYFGSFIFHLCFGAIPRLLLGSVGCQKSRLAAVGNVLSRRCAASRRTPWGLNHNAAPRSQALPWRVVPSPAGPREAVWFTLLRGWAGPREARACIDHSMFYGSRLLSYNCLAGVVYRGVA